jgi:hypothetical protein
VGVWVVVKYFLYQCLLGTLFQIMQVTNASWKSLISGLAQCCYFEISGNLLSEE